MGVATFSTGIWPGVKNISSASLVYVTVLSVDRNGLKYDKTTGTPGNRQYVHDAVAGVIYFNTEGTGSFGKFPRTLNDLEKVNVIYRT